MDQKSEARLSFAKDKVGNYPTGKSGVTGTSDRAINSLGEVTVDFSSNEISFNSSDLLFKNIDKLGEKFSHDERNEWQESESNFDDGQDLNDLSEEQIIADLDKHLNIDSKSIETQSNKNISTKTDNFCRNCGKKYLQSDNFCGICGKPRS